MIKNSVVILMHYMDKIRNGGQAEAKKYAKTKRVIGIAETVMIFAILAVLIFTGLSVKIENFAYGISDNIYIALLVFFAVIGISEAVITFPLSFYSGYILEHRYNLSNQTLFAYFKENAKSLLIGLVIGVPILLIFYFLIKNTGEMWWLYLGIIMFLFSVLLGRIAPVLIFPLFYKFRPIENESLKEKILKICDKSGVKVQGIYMFDMSKNTKKANAAFTGIGKSKRIIIGDTLLNNFSEDETEVIFAHELGHYSKKHIIKMSVLSTVLTFAGLYVTAYFYGVLLGAFGFQETYQLAALPLLALLLSIFGLVTSPLANIQSRKFERDADRYAIETTNNPRAFISSMEKLAEQNLADKTPNKIIEYLFHSHPSIQKRIVSAQTYLSEKA